MTVKNKGGRPCKLTPTCRDAFLECIELGLSLKRAAGVAGVCKDTVETWLSQGKHDKENGISSKFQRFLFSYQQKKEKFIADNLELIRKAAEGKNKTLDTKTTTKYNKDGEIISSEVVTNNKEHAAQWVAAAWLLERIVPEEFSQHKIVHDESADKLAESLSDIIGGSKNEDSEEEKDSVVNSDEKSDEVSDDKK